MPDRLAFIGHLIDGTDYQARALEGQTPMDVMHLMRQRNGVLSAFSNPAMSPKGREVRFHSPTGCGTAVVKLNSATNVLSYNVTCEGLTAAATGARIHGPAPAGQNAGVLFPLTGLTGSCTQRRCREKAIRASVGSPSMRASAADDITFADLVPSQLGRRET